MIESLELDLGERSYPILIGEKLIEQAGELLSPILPRPKTIIISDENVAKLYAQTLQDSLDNKNISHSLITLPAGEASKSFEHFGKLMESLLELQPDRKTTLIALGGGVIGDITGFAASCLLRGVPFIQIPTTLLAQVDSSVGGKTAINSKYGKNLIGAFYQPKAVLADISVFSDLPKRELLSGYAEVVKYGLIDEPDFFSWLENHGKDVIDGDLLSQIFAVKTCCAAKARIVAEDERESGKRALLNLGHTFGHALEKSAAYGDGLRHGEAVALGTLMAFYLSVELGICPASDYQKIKHHFESIGLPTSLKAIKGAEDWDAKTLANYCYQDKKAQDGKLTFILAKGIGQSFISHDVTVKQAEDSFAAFM